MKTYITIMQQLIVRFEYSEHTYKYTTLADCIMELAQFFTSSRLDCRNFHDRLHVLLVYEPWPMLSLL